MSRRKAEALKGVAIAALSCAVAAGAVRADMEPEIAGLIGAAFTALGVLFSNPRN